ncbi:phage tail sheath subtilisin-like domain-containing protein [Lamprobacter modestohalophilus]|uniref:phage tail sheath subtilisin-like domain-containing protein n=1 Tax=Lamprobacter modestohalophilus TaxID=1064514 RepID=UPI002ADED14A|nr:phage tail sheath subtilisin-like domain-containing protein [Lamprobacter modestohalophilus]MEA1053429.1 phage tail sheath subtilisin-like domain-containing protein [Lamprobacter modestohalophilus]
MSSQRFLHGIELIEIDEGARSIRTLSSSIIGLVGTAPEAASAATATLTIGTGEAGLVLTANRVGLVGNSLRFEALPAAEAESALSVEVDETLPGTKLIRVNLASDLAGERSSTAAEVMAAINADAAASALLSASLLGSVGDELMRSSLGPKPLTGGMDEPFPLNQATLISNRRQLRYLGASGTLVRALEGLYEQSSPLVYVVRVTEGASNEETATQVIGGIDAGTGQLHGIRALESVRFGITPRVLIAPGFTQIKPVADALIGVAERLRAVAVLDGPNSTDEAAIDYRSQFSSPRAYLVDPWFIVRRPDGSEEVEPPSARVAGLMAHSDETRGFWFSPSNQAILGTLRTARPISWAINDPDTQANYLNEFGVATFIAYDGVRLWGNRSCSTDPRWQYLSVRRTADMINDSLVRAHLWAVDRAITRSFFDEVSEMVNAYLRHLKSRDALINGRCWVDPELNTPEAIANGQVYFDFDFTPTYPAEHIIFRSRMINDYLEELL